MAEITGAVHTPYHLVNETKTDSVSAFTYNEVGNDK